jgi:outer membrane protein OmpA-like peptidoglycan-associated protein
MQITFKVANERLLAKVLRGCTYLLVCLSFSQVAAQKLTPPPLPSMQIAAIDATPKRQVGVERVVSDIQQPITTQKIILDTGALFTHNKDALDQLSESGRHQMHGFAIKLKALRNVKSIIITGHSDATNGTGVAAYNDKLSLARATAIRAYLQDLGFDTSRMQVVGMGARQPIKLDCLQPKGVMQTSIGLAKGSATQEDMDKFRSCLQPNRRVEVEVFGQDLEASPQLQAQSWPSVIWGAE